MCPLNDFVLRWSLSALLNLLEAVVEDSLLIELEDTSPGFEVDVDDPAPLFDELASEPAESLFAPESEL